MRGSGPWATSNSTLPVAPLDSGVDPPSRALPRLNMPLRGSDTAGAVDLQPIVVQASIAIPVILAVVLYILLRWERTPLHLLVVGLFITVPMWLTAVIVKLVAIDPAVRSAGLDVEMLALALMQPLFIVTMGHIARVRFLEEGWTALVALSVVPVFFALVYLTDAQHQLVFADRQAALLGGHPREWAGPAYWGFQLWHLVGDVAGIGLGFFARWKARTPDERRRVTMILSALLGPLGAHMLYMTGLQPWDFSLAPAALGPTVILFVYAIHRFRLLDAKPIVRSDVIEHLGDGLVLADTHGTVVDANGEAERIIGVTRSGLLGRSMSEVLDLLSAQTATARLREEVTTLALGGGRVGGEVQTHDGRVVEISAGGVAAKGYEPGGRFLSVRDRTEQRRTERLLQDRQKLESVGTLAAGVAHEVNNPLSYVRSNLVHVLDLLAGVDWEKAELAALDEVPEVLAESLEGLDRIASIVQGMLRFSRVPDEGRRSVDLNETVETAMRLAALHRNRTVHVRLQLCADLPHVDASPQRLVQVVLNLLLNGKQALASQEGGCITAETRVDGRDVVLHVEDNGPGIPPELHQRIFDPFFTTRGPDEGTGLGLAIAYEIVREHGGTLELDPSMEGGTRFVVRLPTSRA